MGLQVTNEYSKPCQSGRTSNQTRASPTDHKDAGLRVTNEYTKPCQSTDEYGATSTNGEKSERRCLTVRIGLRSTWLVPTTASRKGGIGCAVAGGSNPEWTRCAELGLRSGGHCAKGHIPKRTSYVRHRIHVTPGIGRSMCGNDQPWPAAGL